MARTENVGGHKNFHLSVCFLVCFVLGGKFAMFVIHLHSHNVTCFIICEWDPRYLDMRLDGDDNNPLFSSTPSSPAVATQYEYMSFGGQAWKQGMGFNCRVLSKSCSLSLVSASLSTPALMCLGHNSTAKVEKHIQMIRTCILAPQRVFTSYYWQ